MDEKIIGVPVVEGKTKVVRLEENPHHVRIQFKDTITTGDGRRADVIPGKGALCARTSVACFKLLRRAGVPCHYLGDRGPDGFCAYRLEMFPVEVVVRRISTGSLPCRRPEYPLGHRFEWPYVEFFLKSDEHGDPPMTFTEAGRVRASDGRRPLPFAAGARMAESGFLAHRPDVKWLATRAFHCLESAWGGLGFTLVDLKLEFGLDSDGVILVGDSIDNDSWRLWPGGDRARQVDKQVYRDFPSITQDGLDQVRRNYEWVANQAERFAEGDPLKT